MTAGFSNAGTNFDVPAAYQWIVDKGLINYDGKSPVEPWHLLGEDARRSLRDIWPGGPSINVLVVFAKRQDNDDYACFEIVAGIVVAIVIIHGWTSSGYDIIETFGSVWDWIKHVVDDVREWQQSVGVAG